MERKKKRVTKYIMMTLDTFTLEMLEQMAYEEDISRQGVIRSAVKFLFQKTFGPQALKKLRKKHKPNNF